MKPTSAKIVLLSLLLIIPAIKAHAHGPDHPDVEIHTFQNGETWTNCSFVFHSSLTQSEFHRFTREAGNIIYFQPLSAASSLGKFKFDIAIGNSMTPIDQTAGAWNNTFAHPEDDVETGEPHWLGDQVQLPNLRARMGITDRIEVGTYFTKDPSANYGFFGADMKYTYTLDKFHNLNLAARGSYAQLFGPEDVKMNVSAVDVLASKKFWLLEPYVGGSVALNHARETTDAVDLANVNSVTPRVMMGTRFNWKFVSASVEYDVSVVNTLGFKLGATF